MSEAAGIMVLQCTCGQKMRVPAEAMGKSTACVKCGEKLKVSPENSTPIEPGASARPPASGTPPSQPSVSAATPVQGSSGTVEAAIALLIEKGLVDDATLREARLVQRDMGRSTWETLIDIERVSADVFHALMAKQGNVANIDLKNYTIPGDVLPFVPEDLVKRGMLFPIDKLGKLLTVAMPCPIDGESIREVQERTGLTVKLKLCNLRDLRDLIREHFPPKREAAAYDDVFGKELSREFADIFAANDLAARVFDMTPPLPATATVAQFAKATQAPGASPAGLMEVAVPDPAATARLLSVANSAAYGFARRVDNIGLALTLLGQEAACGVMARMGGTDYLAKAGDMDYKSLWQRARMRGEVARALAETAGSQRGPTVWTAALLLEIGRFALDALLPNSYGALTKGKSGAALVTEEQRLYGFTHAGAGYILARAWNYPPSITEPIRHWNTPDDATKSREIVALVALAARMTTALESRTEMKDDGLDGLCERANLTRDQADGVFKRIAAAG